VVGDGQALIIGGHYYERQIDGESGIPVLRGIPVLGGLFRNRNSGYQKQERLFILSPRLVALEDIQKNTQQYGELFERAISTPPVYRQGGGGCMRQPSVQVIPPVPADSPLPPATAAGTGSSP
jgi:type III secretion protein C